MLLAITIGVGALLVTPAEAARCICPQIYAPVECANGKTYPNQCVADCRNARECVPAGLDFESATQVSQTTYPWLDTPLASEIVSCAEERGAKLFALPYKPAELDGMMAKGKPPKTDPCDTCGETLGPCDRISCSPCCYSCPGLPYVVCVDY